VNKRSLYTAHRRAGAGVRASARKAGYAHGVPTEPARRLEEHTREIQARRDYHLGKPAPLKMRLNALALKLETAQAAYITARLDYEASLAINGGLE